MNYIMKLMNPAGGLELLPGELVNKLIRSRVLENYRNSYDEYMVAVDAVHLYTKKGKHPMLYTKHTMTKYTVIIMLSKQSL